MSDATYSDTRRAMWPAMAKAIAAGIAAGLVVRFAMDPLAISLAGATFAAPAIYAFMLKSATGAAVGGGVGLAIHWGLFALVLPIAWAVLATGRSRGLRVVLGLIVPTVFWLLLMTVLMPLMGLPPFYNFSLTTIWSGFAFAVLGVALAAVGALPRR